MCFIKSANEYIKETPNKEEEKEQMSLKSRKLGDWKLS